MAIATNPRSKLRLRAKLRSHLIRNMPEFVKPTFYRKMIKIELEPPPGLELRLARTQDELAQAFRLLHDNYVKQGYMDPHVSGMRLTKFHSLPSTSTLIACIDGKVVGTVSLVRNGAFGTPLESVCNLESYRRRGERVAEVSSLAVDPAFSGQHGRILFPLLNYLYHYCEYYFGVDFLAIAVHPSWWDFYRHVLLFEQLETGEISKYGFVKGAPAAMGILDLRTARESFSRIYGHKPPEQNLFEFLINMKLPYAKYPVRPFGSVSDPVLSPEMLQYFFREQSNVFASLTNDETLALWEQYEAPKFRMVLPRPMGERDRESARKAGARHDVEVPVTVRINSGRSIKGVVKNASSKGALLVAERAFRKGEQIQIEFDFASIHPKFSDRGRFSLDFCVQWSRSTSGMSGLELMKASAVWVSFMEGLENYLNVA